MRTLGIASRYWEGNGRKDQSKRLLDCDDLTAEAKGMKF
jgi:hypothetical protein